MAKLVVLLLLKEVRPVHDYKRRGELDDASVFVKRALTRLPGHLNRNQGVSVTLCG